MSTPANNTIIYFARGDDSNFAIYVTDTDSIVEHLIKLIKNNKDLNFLNKAPVYSKILCFNQSIAKWRSLRICQE